MIKEVLLNVLPPGGTGIKYMKIFGIKTTINTRAMNLKKKPVFIIILLLGFTLNGVIVQAQCFPQPDECNQNDCDIDNVSLAIAADGANVFCDGESAIVAIDESQTITFDYFVYYWCDGVVDTLGFDEQPASHVYNIADEDLCEADEDSYFVRVVGVLDCGNGNITCRTAGVSLTIKYRPLALFSAPVQVCVDEPISFGNASCNTEEYLWDFGDNSPASTAEFPDHVYDSPGFYTVTLTVSNDCVSDTQTQTIEVVGEPEVDILQTDMLACAGSEIDFESTFNSYTNINWNITPNDTLLWCYTDTLIHAGSPTISLFLKQPYISPV